jgi:arabinofuranan 3-O-arabinosyltransferase
VIEAPQRAAPALRLGRLADLSPWRLAARWRDRVSPRERQWLLVLLGCCVLLVALPFFSHPGQILADTKIDLAINPAGFLRRALHLWDPAQFGQLQNQAVGYFFPVGPFFLLGKLVALPGWVVQRLWIAFLLIAAFSGVVRLCRLLTIGTPATQIIGALSYALAPTGLSLLGTLSSEFLPIAMLPWILVPLVRTARAGPDAGSGERLRAVAQSALAVAMCSGINAAATGAVLIPPVIYLLTAARPAPRWRILSWWVPAVLLAISWWLYPLLLLSKYGVSLLPYTESAAVTTSATSLSDTLRGTENWITYLVVDGQPWWPVGFRISTGAMQTIVTGIASGLGLAGLVSRRLLPRRFLLCVVLTGTLIILTGYVSALGNPLAASVDHIINGPLAPLRNLRKFDPLIRLPVALGLASLLATVRPQLPRRALAGLAAGAIALLAVPVYVSGLSTPGSFASVPAYWTSAAAWLTSHAGNEGVLEEPGARFGQYTWGSPMDDILEPLFDGDWASSQLSAVGSAGNTRLLESIDQQMADGAGSAGLTEVLARMGVKYLVVRNDLIRSDLRGAWPALIHQAIDESPGISEVAQFGSATGSAAPANAVSSFDPPYPPVQIYQVSGAQPAAVIQPTAEAMRVYGAPESLLTLANQGLLDNRPVLLNSAAPQVRASSTVVTDSLRRRVRNFGEIRDDYSPTLTATQPLSTFEATADFLPAAWLPYLSVAKYTGIAGVTASSSASDIDAIPGQSATGRLPFAAVDGSLATMWESGSLGGPVGQWIRVDLTRPLNPGTVKVAFADNSAIGPQVTSVKVSTATGERTDRVSITGGYQSLRLPAGQTTWVQLTVTGVFRPPAEEIGRQVGIAEISVPGVTASRTIEAPDVKLPGGRDPSATVLAKAEPQPSGCMLTSQLWVCSPQLEKSTEEQFGFDEGFAVARPQRASLSGTAVLTSVALAERYAFPGRNEPVVTASSVYTDDPQDAASSAFDGSPQTTWISGAGDARPALTIRWRGRKRISMIMIERPAGVTGPLAVRITGSAGQVRTGVVGSQGLFSPDSVTFAPMKTRSLTLTFAPAAGQVQISDVRIPGVQPLTSDGSADFRLPCGLGPEIRVDGTLVPTSVSGTFTDVLEAEPMRFTACSAVTVGAGQNDVVEPGSDGFSVQSVAVTGEPVTSLSAASAVPALAAPALQWSASRRVVRVSAGQQSFLIVNENFNAGWQARLHGRVLQPVQLDGWKQGWLLPAGSQGQVVLTYPPDTAYRAALLGGLIALAIIVIIAVAPPGLRRRHRRGRPRPPTAAAPPRQRSYPARPRASVLLTAGVVGTAAFGLWIGGYPGAVLLPVIVGSFMSAAALRPASAFCRALCRPWLLAILMLAAAVSSVAGGELTGNGAAHSLAGALSGAVPQLLCLIIIGRLIAALVLPGTKSETGAMTAAPGQSDPGKPPGLWEADADA